MNDRMDRLHIYTVKHYVVSLINCIISFTLNSIRCVKKERKSMIDTFM